MKNDKTKKELQAQYKEREISGGVYVIKNTLSDKILFAGTTDLQGSKNRFSFAQQTGSCVDLKLKDDWNKQGADQFTFEVLEDLRKGDTQTAKEFSADIETLKAMWLENLSGRDFY